MTQNPSRRGVIMAGGSLAAGFALSTPYLATAATSDVVKIAAPLELSGPAAGFGLVFHNAAKVTVEEINKAGGIRSLGGARLELLVEDTRSDLQRSLELVDKLASEKNVVATIGPTTTAAAIAASQKCEQLLLPYLSSAQVNDAIVNSNRRHFFRVSGRVNTYVDGVVDYIKGIEKETGIVHKKVGIVTIDVEPGTIMAARYEGLCKANGWDFVSESYDFRTTRDFTPMISRLRTSGVDLVVGSQFPLDAVLFAKAAQQLDFNPLGFVWALGGQYLNSFITSVGKASEFMLVNSFTAPAAAAASTRDLDVLYKAQFNEPLIGYAGVAPAAVAVIADAVERAATVERKIVREFIAATDIPAGAKYMTLPGGVKFDAQNSNVRGGGALLQIVGGEQHLVWPPDKATRKAVWPRPAWSKI